MFDLRVIVNVEAAIFNDERFLLVIRGDKETHAAGMLSLPGGKVEAHLPQDDILEATIRREVYEEVGIEVGDAIYYIESKFFVSDQGQPVVDIVFLCQYCGGTVTIQDTGEIAEVQWLTADEVAQHSKAASWTRRSVQLAEHKRVAQRSSS